MEFIVVVLLIAVAVKLVILGILWLVFRQEIKDFWAGKSLEPEPETSGCIYCHSPWIVALDEGRTQWEGDELVLVTSYECQSCELPFWRVERLRAGIAQR